jgi:NTP pyrophosphatase (non-canonical NTP hydrolase)
MDDFLTKLRRINGERAEAWLMGQRSDPLFWAVELGGEVGEILNVVKKLVREELGWRGSRATAQDLADEIADGIICLDNLARHYGIDIASAVAAKFNATSDKNGFPHKIALTTAQAETAALRAEVEALREANSILEAALIETCKEFPNSAAERWIDEQLELARAALTEPQP